ncbi:uncharacterized protein LOC129795537 [Lutzomyia longipalpis]|uniref:uncharacterized protein LOC129795537 n=1 Tax=Lutzomyia longipalpis TaxID=7200 RepID=UPI00248359E6|nr:uncharacterized protein LOC129795537 [Lutzomyia longipalpis]
MKRKEIKRKHIKKSVNNYLRSKDHVFNEDVTDEDGNYFLGILNVLREEENDDAEGKELLARNVMDYTRGREITLASHQIASKVIENLLEYCNEVTLGEYQDAFKQDIRTLCANRFSSHVLEKLISLSATRFLTNSAEGSNPPEKKIKEEAEVDPGEKCKLFVETCSKFLLNNMEDFVWDPYANHVIRTCLKSLSGQMDEKLSFPGVPEEWGDVVKEYASRLRDWPFFVDFPYQELTSGLLQTLTVALARIDKSALKSIGGFFTQPQNTEDPVEENKEEAAEDAENPSKLHKLFTTESSIRFLEVLIGVAGKKLFSKIFLRLFQGNLKELSLMKSANFCVQKILDNMKEKEELSSCFTELDAHTGEILQNGYTGVILSLCQACRRLEINQHQFIRSLKRALNCQKEGNFALCVLKLKPQEMVAEDTSTFVHIHGSLIVQEMLKFRKPIDVIQSILTIPPDQLVNLLNTAKGSFLVDAFFASPHVGEKSRVSFVNHLIGFFIDLAINKFGSRSIERLFEASSSELRCKIIAELAEKINKLQSTPFGFIVSKKLHVAEYKQNAKRWNSIYNKGHKK